LEQAARRFALAALETKLKSRSDELERVQQELAKLTATEGTTAGALVTAQNELTNITNEVKALRDTVREAQKDVDHQFDIVVKVTDEVNQMRRVKADLENRQRPLQAAVSSHEERHGQVGSPCGRRRMARAHRCGSDSAEGRWRRRQRG
jgi:chromosome segregation ATPase